jgi:hypothetical protein
VSDSGGILLIMTNDEVLAAIAAWLSGAPGAAEELREKWDAGAPAWHRCLVAHYAADTEASPVEALVWNDRALDAAMELEPGVPGPVGFDRDAMLPSLHLNCAEDHRRLGDHAAAARHLQLGRSYSSALADDGYGRLIIGGLDRLAARLADERTVAL